MAISKKSLGKVLAISMASAMAMSSLSAALVSVSAVQDPALASNGQVDFKTDAEDQDGETIIKETFALSDIDDDAVDAVGGGNMKLSDLENALKAAGFTYTDSDGVETDLTGVEVEFKVTSGTSYLKYYKDTKLLAAQDKSGSATLQIKVTGDVDIGGGRDDKSVTFTQNIKFDVHKAGEIGLKAYESGKSGRDSVTEADLNDLAAYGSTLKYQLVQYVRPVGENNLIANVNDIGTGNIGGATQDPASPETQKAYIKNEIASKLPDGLDAADLSAGFAAALDKAMTPVDEDQPEGAQHITSDAWTIFREATLVDAVTEAVPYEEDDKDVVAALTKLKTENADKIYEVPAAEARAKTELEPGVYMESADGNDIEGKVTDSKGDEHTVWTAGAATKLLVGADKTILGIVEGAENAAAKELKVKDDQGAKEALAQKTATELENAGVVKTESGKYYASSGTYTPNGIQWSNSGTDEDVFDTTQTADEATTLVNIGGSAVADQVWVEKGTNTIKTTYKVVFDNTVDNPDSKRDAIKVKDVFRYGSYDNNGGTGTNDLKSIVENAYTQTDFVDEGNGEGDGGDQGVEPANFTADGDKITNIRFYAGSGQELFKVVNNYDGDGSTDWVRSTKTNTDKGKTSDTGTLYLRTDGSSGTGSIKVAVSHMAQGADETATKPKVDEITLNVKVVKAANFGSDNVTIDRSGSKTFADNDLTGDKNINGFEIRTSGDVLVENGTVGAIKKTGPGSVVVNGGRTGTIDAEDADIDVTEDGRVGDIINALSVDVSEGGEAGNITADANVTLTEGTIASIDVDGDVTINGGTVTGNLIATGDITISSDDTDGNDDALDTTIGGNVTLLAGGNEGSITINNSSDDGAATLAIRGNVIAKHVDTGNSNDTATVSVGDADTTGLIQIGGVVEGEVIQLGGNGLVSLAGVRAASEVERGDDDGETIESTLIFDGFNSSINAINNFANVRVNEGTVIVKGAVNATELTVNSDAQIVADSMTIEEDIVEGGSIVVPVGKLTVTGSVDDAPALALTGELTEGALAFVGNRGLVDAFDMGGVTLRAERQSNGNYNYLISKVELNGLTAIGKDVATGVKQEKKVSVALDGTLPEGASIVWESDDADIATVAGNGANAVITGEDVGTTTVTAKIVDANGRELGYEDASFDVNVLDNATVDSIGGDIGPDDNQVDLDTKKKNMEAGQVYTFMVRGNNDVENISVTSGDTNVATVALANGADSRGALYNITAVADGKTDITVTYQGKTSKIAVKVGGFQLDTSSKKMAPGQVYSVLAKNVPADQAGNVTLTYDNNIVDVVKVNDNYNGRGVLFNVTAKAIGETEVKVTHNGETETMAVNVVENTGRLTLDTASYTMPFGGSYTIGVKVEKNGRQLSGEEVRAMITSGELVVTDSRTGSIVTTEVQANGNVRVTGRQNEGTTYVQFIVMQNGQRVTHASVGVTVQNGATAGGSSVRSISQW